MISPDTHRIQTPHGSLHVQSWTPPVPQRAPSLILLHDSLGSVALWRDFPERLAQATGRQVIAYDRLGFGQSDARHDRLPTSFVRDEAHGDFAAVVRHFGLEQFVVLGHSVGGGMGVCVAAAYPQACVGLVTISAQAFVESVTLDGLREAQARFAHPGQLERLQKYHGDKAAWVLEAWLGTWLSEEFSTWTLDEQLAQVRCPVLCIHGDRDEYGSLAHQERIAAGVRGPVVRRVLSPGGHFPHREQPEWVIAEVQQFLAAHVAPAAPVA